MSAICKKSRGVTLIELTIASFIMLLILDAVYQLFIQARRNYERPRASMSQQEDMLHLVRNLQRDLEETSLQTVTIFPNPTAPLEPPGMSLESPRDDNNLLQFGSFGVVLWQNFVYYTLDGGGPQLVRKELPLANAQLQAPSGDPTHLAPAKSLLVPSGVVSTRSRTMITDIAVPNKPTITNPKVDPASQLGPSGGFQVTLTGDSVNVVLILHDVSTSTGKDTVQTYTVTVHPRN